MLGFWRAVKNPRFLAIGFLLIMFVMALVFLPLDQLMMDLQTNVQVNGQQAFFMVTGLIALGFVLMLPSSVLMMLAGFLFGVMKGFIAVWIAGLLASSVAFWIARTIARPWIERKIRRKSSFIAIDRAIHRKGFLVVLLTRMVMVLPFPALNYTLGLTSVRFRDYLVGTVTGMIPPYFLFVFLGTTAGDVSAIVRGDVSLKNNELIIALAAAIFVVIIVLIIIRMAGRMLKKELVSPES